MVDDFLGQRARVGLALLGQHHGGIRLIIAEAQIGGGGDGGGCGLAEGGWRARRRGGLQGPGRVRGHRGGVQAPGVGAGHGRFGIEDGEDFIAGLRLAELAAGFAVGEHFGDRRQRPQVQVVVLARDDEEDDEVHRRVVERLEINAGLGAAEDRHHLLQIVGKRVGNGHSGADAGAHLVLALP
jgi:hypothetical protein